jgi:hypothetical protein
MHSLIPRRKSHRSASRGIDRAGGEHPIEPAQVRLQAILVGPRRGGEPHDPAALEELRAFASLAAGAVRPGPN